MAAFKTVRFDVRPEAREQAERAMHELAAMVRRDLPDASLTVYRDRGAPARYISLIRSDKPAAEAPALNAFTVALASFVAGDVEETAFELVTSSDLAPRRRPDRRR